MARVPVSRRTVLQGAAALSLAQLTRGARAAPFESSSLVVIYLNGGPCGLFNSADSFLDNGGFGVTAANVRRLEGGLCVDAATFGSLPERALARMASINFKHGMYKHELARAALLQTGDRSNLLLLAQTIPDPAPIRCAVVNSLGFPAGVDPRPPPEAGIALERVLDLREIGVFSGDEHLERTAAAYRVPAATSAIADTRTSFLAAELLVRQGAHVVFTQPLYDGRPDRQLDTHHDSSGREARAIMGAIVEPLRTFVGRMLAMERNVVIALMGEFSRTLGESDHEPGGTATVIGRYVKAGTAGRQTPDGAPPPGSPGVGGLWSYLCAVLQLDDPGFGPNPNPELVRA